MRKNQYRVNIWWCVHAAVVVLLVSVNLSTATYNPAYHPQHPNWNPGHQQLQQQEQEQPHVHWEDPARGGSTVMAHPPPEEMMQQQHQEEPYQPPKILLKHMSMALRVTSEWNRRLLNGVHRFQFIWKRKLDSTQQPPLSQQQPDQHQGPYHSPQSNAYGSLPVNVHPSRPWHPPIPPTLQSTGGEEDELTLFHAKAPRDPSASSSSPEGSSRKDDATAHRGVARWGPELLPYLEHIVELLEISPGGVEIPLAMIYLDRACSVETPRSNSVPPCPFCIPRTVHRLSLASLLLATQAVKGLSDTEMQTVFEKLASSFGIPEVQLQQMVEWMRGALGDTGLMVTVSQMKLWGQHWESIFFRQQQQPLYHHQRNQAQPAQQQQQQQGLEYHQSQPQQYYQ